MAHTESTLTVIGPDQHRFELIHVEHDSPRWRLLMVPAMGISARHYIGFSQALRALGAEVFIHEWRGLGSSSLRASRDVDWGYRELLMDLEGSLNTLQALPSHTTPLIVAGHSLGSQLGLLINATRPEAFSGAVCIAGGSPYYKVFPWPMGWALRGLFWAMPMLARWVGHYPGQSLGFAKRESRSVMQDWADSGKCGQYQPKGVGVHLEGALAEIETPILGIRMQDDWFVPPKSLEYLLKKCPKAHTTTRLVGQEGLGGKADHYRWMSHPKTTALAIADWVTQFPSNRNTRR